MEDLVTNRLFTSFYKNKKIFITGHTGFKGSWLVAVLHLLGASVKGYALAPEPDGLFNFLDQQSLTESIIADIRDRERLAKEIKSFNPDLIFHLAAQPLVRRSYEIPAETFDVNVTGTANLLEAANKLENNPAIIVITTDKVYHNREEDVLYKEDDILGGYDPYSASKACAELVVDSFRKSFSKKSIASVRAGNVIGGGDWSRDRIIPDIVNSLKKGEAVLVRSPKAVRPWQHVLEAVSGYLLLGIKLYNDGPEFSKAYNFGPVPGDHLPVEELVKKAIAVWGHGEWKDVSHGERPHEAGLLKLDITKALKELQWKPKLDADKAIEWTINWYKQTDDQKSSATSKQIKKYFLL